jgi:hypothetical protein
MDAIRWGGNVGMHEGSIRPQDGAEIARDLFDAINLLGDTAPRIEAVVRTHRAMPEATRSGIEKRRSRRSGKPARPLKGLDPP